MLYFSCQSAIKLIAKARQVIMKSITFEGEITEYQGEAVSPARKFNGVVDQFETLAEAKASEDWPGDNEILKMVNAKKLANARSAVYQTAAADLKTKYESTPAFKMKQLVKALVATGKGEAEAKGIAESLVG